MDDWKIESEYKENVLIDIGFMVQDSFYYGPENGFTPEEHEKKRVPVYQPNLNMSGSFVLASDVFEKESELLAHYKDVIKKYTEFNKDITKSTHFWNRPIIYQKDGFNVSFPWHDRFHEGKNVLDNFTVTEDGEVYWDIDQGWELEIYGKDDLLYIREREPESEEVYCNVSFNWQNVREQSSVLITKVHNLIQYLSNSVGRDYWT
ncbi:hypothetical protein MNBD_GAMMA16-1159 [hydrothermal vent metagenome]|uniref:Uncharacterized protein n=1 Tax=hydrothermal vent metagenome TaxID=652676 RepID=A0A3B0YS03_9ZZZZ